MSVIQFKCKKCGAQEYVIKEVPNGSNVHKGLYCAKCGAWEKWLSDCAVKPLDLLMGI